MPATYTNTLPTDKDWVRFLIGDTVVASARLSDEEINAVITETQGVATVVESVKYFAAADCLRALSAQWSSAGAGVLEKEVDDLRIRWGIDSSGAQAITDYIRQLEAKGGNRTIASPKVYRAIGGNR